MAEGTGTGMSTNALPEQTHEVPQYAGPQSGITMREKTRFVYEVRGFQIDEGLRNYQLHSVVVGVPCPTADGSCPSLVSSKAQVDSYLADLRQTLTMNDSTWHIHSGNNSARKRSWSCGCARRYSPVAGLGCKMEIMHVFRHGVEGFPRNSVMASIWTRGEHTNHFFPKTGLTLVELGIALEKNCSSISEGPAEITRSLNLRRSSMCTDADGRPRPGMLPSPLAYKDLQRKQVSNALLNSGKAKHARAVRARAASPDSSFAHDPHLCASARTSKPGHWERDGTVGAGKHTLAFITQTVAEEGREWERA